MGDKARLIPNIVANVLQMLAGAGLIFALYRYINITLGVEQLGVWSVVLATVSASRLADLGLSAGVIRFVSRDLARGVPEYAAQVIDTVALTLMIAVAVLLPLIYPLLEQVLPYLFDSDYLVRALEILPYAMISMWLIIIAAVFQGGLDGCNRMDLRAVVVVTGQIVLLVLAIWLVPKYGLVGLAWAQLGQGVFLIVVGRWLLRRILPQLSRVPWRWHKSVLREIFGYSLNIQATTLIMLLFDPVAKALIARFGGAAAAGYFEIANQVVRRVRAVIVAANQAIVPHVAALAENEPASVSRFYHQSTRALVFVTLPTFALLIAWGGGVSWLLMGAYQLELVRLLGIVAVAWSLNIFASPAYFTNMGSGHVGWNTISHVIMGFMSVGFGWVLGSRYGAEGVAIAYALALATGSLLLIAVFQHRHRLRWRDCFAREHLGLAIVSTGVATFGWFEPLRPSAAGTVALVAQCLLLPMALALAIWCHPLRHQLWRQLTLRPAQA